MADRSTPSPTVAPQHLINTAVPHHTQSDLPTDSPIDGEHHDVFSYLSDSSEASEMSNLLLDTTFIELCAKYDEAVDEIETAKGELMRKVLRGGISGLTINGECGNLTVKQFEDLVSTVHLKPIDNNGLRK